MKKCMEFRVECRTPVGRPRRTWLESVEADVAKLKIDIKKWRENVMNRKSNPIGKWTISRLYIYIYINLLSKPSFSCLLQHTWLKVLMLF